MEYQGGFCNLLAQAFYKADKVNAVKLISAFPELFSQKADK
jgi:hypothetical protein